MGVGKQIKYYREQRNLSQRRLAKLAGIAPASLCKVEKEDWNMRSQNLIKVAQALNISVDELTKSSILPRTPESILAEYQYVQPVTIPVVAEGSGGEGNGFEEYAYMARNKASGRNIKGILVKGNCLEPEICEGDILLVDADLNPQNNDIVVCLIDDKIQIKRYRQFRDKIWLENRHGQFDITDVQIQGVVIEKNVKMR